MIQSVSRLGLGCQSYWRRMRPRRVAWPPRARLACLPDVAVPSVSFPASPVPESRARPSAFPATLKTSDLTPGLAARSKNCRQTATNSAALQRSTPTPGHGRCLLSSCLFADGHPGLGRRREAVDVRAAVAEAALERIDSVVVPPLRWDHLHNISGGGLRRN